MTDQTFGGDLKPQTPTEARNPRVVIAAGARILPVDLRTLWEYRELLFFLAWREISIRYKQTALGVVWAVLQPALKLLIFSLVFGVLIEVPSDGFPYPVFILTGLLPWEYFAGALSRGSGSLVQNSQLVSKVFFPRMVIPLSAVITPLVDFGLSLLVLFPVMAAWGISPFSAKLLALPLFVLLAFVTALAVVLWLSALNVQYRDVTHIIPFFIQIWMYLTPVIYPSSLIPGQFRALYGLNPMAGVTEGFRWALLDTPDPNFAAMGLSAVVVVLVLVGGLVYFGRMEQSFGDII